ncbi:hypothetical protein [Streptomyces sp. NPDC057413]
MSASSQTPDGGTPKGAREIRHPSMLPTRRYLAKNPLPVQQDRRAS